MFGFLWRTLTTTITTSMIKSNVQISFFYTQYTVRVIIVRYSIWGPIRDTNWVLPYSNKMH